MISRVDPGFKQKLQKFGNQEWNECFHCGNCTAICPLTGDNNMFPRKTIRLAQMGLTKSLAASADPWLCYYCGECSETCPRGANPGELMMVLRRYLTSVYDWTGISRLFYTRKIWEVGTLLVMAIAILASFLVFLPPSSRIFSDPQAFVNSQGGVMINSLVDRVSPKGFMAVIERGDLLMALVVAALLISNILHMFYRVILSDKNLKVPFQAYFTEFWTLIFNFFTQSHFSKCDNRTYWVGHLLLMTGYTIMFTMIVALLPQFQIEEVKPWYHWQRILGYYSTFGLLFFLIYTFIGRIRRKEFKMQFSHPSDWIFLIMLFFTTVTGILVHIFRVTGLPAATYYTYIIHLAILVPMIIIEVPFSKWSHLAYRPFAIYFDRLRKAAVKHGINVSMAATA
jgi:ferredoxin